MGPSLTRVSFGLFGSEPANWQAATASPGQITTIDADFNDDGLTDAVDIDLLCGAIGGNDLQFDLNGNQVVDEQDVAFMLDQVLRVPVGDANLDGQFDSSDLVSIFAAGEYEDNVAANSGWATGDWNCDQEFNTSDLVAAFQAGAYVSNAVAAATATSSLEQPTFTLLSNIAARQQQDELARDAVIGGEKLRFDPLLQVDRPQRPLMVDDHIYESGQGDWLEQDPPSDVDPTNVDAIFGTDDLDETAKRGYGTL